VADKGPVRLVTDEEGAAMQEFRKYISTPAEIIDDIRAGRMVIVIDDEDRENEGDLIVAAEKADAEAVNFMARYGRGLICLSMTRERVEALNLPLMARENRAPLQTAFTVSIEAAEGVTTGISAADRARTVEVAIDPTKGPRDIVSPGHVFPLVARDGGVLARAGHTEAAVDLSRLAGMNPSGVICEIMNDDGSMARLPDLVQFAQHHNLKIGTIADLIAYRMRNDSIVARVVETKLSRADGGEFKLIVYRNTMNGTEHVAAIKGDISGDEPVLVRMHAINILDDVLGDTTSGRSGELETALRMIAEEGKGVVVLIRESWNTSFSNQVRMRHNLPEEAKDEAPRPAPVLRDYGVGAQILVDLGVRQMRLMTNVQRTIVGIDGYGLSVVERVPLPHGVVDPDGEC
jgi:3,4-dihydroxy 2-butanone 4-phosphate synthase/GTP cyclohydrolase II